MLGSESMVLEIFFTKLSEHSALYVFMLESAELRKKLVVRWKIKNSFENALVWHYSLTFYVAGQTSSGVSDEQRVITCKSATPYVFFALKLM